jgi:hypothetical protein
MSTNEVERKKSSKSHEESAQAKVFAGKIKIYDDDDAIPLLILNGICRTQTMTPFCSFDVNDAAQGEEML